MAAADLSTETAGVFVFDGTCALCRGLVSRVQHWTAARAELSPGDPVALLRLGVSEADAARSVQWVGRSGERSAGAAAIAAWLITSPSRRWRLAGHVLRSRAVRFPAEGVYRLVAQNRRLLGRVLLRS